MKITFAATNGPIEYGNPEVIAAAYARISRSEKPVSALRDEACADIEKARKSNSKIVFDMGHSSIAEHAFFNIDIENVSRVCIAEIEKHRLVSYTEKSQRYVDLHNAEFYNIGNEKIYEQAQAALKLYSKMVDGGIPREDARYVLPHSILGQLGMSINARSLESLIRALSASELPEAQEVGAALLQKASTIVPSLIRHITPTQYEYANNSLEYSEYPCLPSISTRFGWCKQLNPQPICEKEKFIAWLFDFELKDVDNFYFFRVPKHLKSPLQYTSLFDDMIPDEDSKFAPWCRAFEFVRFTFDVCCSAACYDQFKRHRIQDIMAFPYHEAYGFTLPNSIKNSDYKEEVVNFFLENHDMMSGSNDNVEAAYSFLQGNRRRFVCSMNLRELMHLFRLRLHEHAQWEIRELAREMARVIELEMPNFWESAREWLGYFGIKEILLDNDEFSEHNE
jgi:thymidylate synthase ThyX